MEEQNLKGEQETEQSVQDEENEDEKKGKKKQSFSILRCIVIAAVLTVAALAMLYFGLVYRSKKVAKDVAEIYADGTGEDLAELFAPGYVAYFEEQFSYADFASAQEQYLQAFRTELQPDVGVIQDIDVRIDSLITASNVSEFADNFETYGVQGVSKYKQLDMTWSVTGTEGKKNIHAQACIFRCDDGWFLDYIIFQYD